eukprot:TRINITY_DN4386_c0_g2_i8.p2 TRINITY_DN4386_c0_g2~~TRINITY_DN4386_c0_g2_i8.p2  ORF type:complete len:262 (-),score=124.07 TRINITY_DN4386_c0_g2_i8:1045-1830(-)
MSGEVKRGRKKKEEEAAPAESEKSSPKEESKKRKEAPPKKKEDGAKKTKKEPLVENRRLEPSSEKRERKKVERLAPVAEQKKEVVIPKGKGSPLEKIDNVAYMIKKTSRNDESLHLLHTAIFGHGKRVEFKPRLLQFSGLVYKEGKEKEDREKLAAKLNKHTIPELKNMMKILDLPLSGTKEELVERSIKFLEKPKDSGNPSIEAAEEKAKKKKERAKKKKKEGSKKRKATTKKEKKGTKKGKVEEKDEDEDEEQEETPPS